MGILAQFWLSNAWFPAVSSFQAVILRDVNGVAIFPGDTVSIDCSVVSILPSGVYTGNLGLSPIHPNNFQNTIVVNCLSVHK